jgi:hypothetical protein
MKKPAPAAVPAPPVEAVAETPTSDKQRRKAAEKLAKEAVKRFQAAKAKGKSTLPGQSTGHQNTDAKVPGAPTVAKPMNLKIPSA